MSSLDYGHAEVNPKTRLAPSPLPVKRKLPDLVADSSLARPVQTLQGILATCNRSVSEGFMCHRQLRAVHDGVQNESRPYRMGGWV
jgi:hypothetical protein